MTNLKPQAGFTSILDNDFYKFTMQQGVIKLFPFARARYKFINRGQHAFPPNFDQALRAAIDAMATLKLTKDEKYFLEQSCPYLDPVYLDFLEGYTYNPEEVSIVQTADEIEVHIEVLWYRTILWEVPILSLISELFYVMKDLARVSDEEIIEKTKSKIENYRQLGITVAEFGTRRRHSYHVHHLVMGALSKFGKGAFIGTSNVHFAMKFNTKPIGTHAHEWFMFHGARYGFKMANVMGLSHWAEVYRGDLGIALSDTYTTDVFFRQFDKMFSKLFDGVRHDSGDPLEFADKLVAHYKKMGIDPLSKTIIFSDGLNYEKVAHIAKACKEKIGISFGIGTSLTNDVGAKPMNMVIKMTQAMPKDDDWIDVVKLSDESGKHTGNERTIELAKEILGIE
ncbi:nicotinate phosphoribosyltransferase [Pedobacter sp. UYP30]|uniref:nicotinate phosphoribosyltransferase n=1 Tax=Pedobacter sp. UYP30 TaxID=1756400 RepID=UPI0033987539